MERKVTDMLSLSHNCNFIVSIKKHQNPKIKSIKSPCITNTRIFSKSYGGYSINLNFETPSQTISESGIDGNCGTIVDFGSNIYFYGKRKYSI
jgi:hypothetical protein